MRSFLISCLSSLFFLVVAHASESVFAPTDLNEIKAVETADVGALKSAPIAMVWDGPGVCRPGCPIAAARMANRAGYRVRFITPKTRDFSVFDEAKIWIQPGGKSVVAMASMGPELMERIRNFVRNGGGYVGFCAGMFASTEQIGTSGKPGLGLIPGGTELYLKQDPPATMVRVSTDRGYRYMYYAGGPFAKISDEDMRSNDVTVTARYRDGSIAAIRSRYGLGRVAVSGFHPEAGFIWKLVRFLRDKDGSDADFAISMIRYAAAP